MFRNEHLPANQMKFEVPLWFSKLDIRDYLFHVYNVEIVGARSYVKQSQVMQGKPDAIRPQVKRWFRPRSRKFMTVELLRPFVWPEQPADLNGWGYDSLKKQDKEGELMQKTMSSTGDTVINKERREKLREQAQALLDGKVKWSEWSEKKVSYTKGPALTRK